MVYYDPPLYNWVEFFIPNISIHNPSFLITAHGRWGGGHTIPMAAGVEFDVIPGYTLQN